VWTTGSTAPDASASTSMSGLPDPDWYFTHVLADAVPGGPVRTASGPAATWQAWWRRQVSADPATQQAARQGYVLRAGELGSVNVSRSAVRTALRHGRWTSAGYGAVSPVDVRAGAPADRREAMIARRRHALRCAAAALRRPGHVVSGRSAAVLHGLPTFAVPVSPELTHPTSVGLGHRAGAHIFGAALDGTDCTRWFGIPVVNTTRTLVDLARHDRRDGLLAADAALREGLLNRSEIHQTLATACGWPGVRQARSVLALADPRAESALESLLRLALHDAGFPPPVLQAEIGGYRVDMLWPEYRLIAEADGREKYTGDELWREKRRETRLRALGYRIERVLWADVTRYWPQTSARLWQLFRVPA
jgi:very-short-patch-repair endonuclease